MFLLSEAAATANDVMPPPYLPPWHATTLFEALLSTALFGVLGIVLLFLGYKVFDRLTPHLHIEKDLAENNLAVAIVVAAMLISLSIIVARTFG